MRVLQAGIDKSGNYWLWRIIRLLMAEAKIPQRSWIAEDPIYEVAKTWTLSFPQATELDVITWDQVPSSAYRAANTELQPFRERSYYYCVIPMYRRRIEDLGEYVRRNSHLWTHAPWHDDLPQELFGEIDKIVYIVRDPRDVLVSAAHFVDTEYCRKEFGIPHLPLSARFPRLLKGCAEWAVHTAGWIGHARQVDLHVVSYEGLCTDLDWQLRRMATYFELDLSDEQLERVAEAVSFGSMKSAAGSGHVRRGRVGSWRDELPADVAEKAASICSPLIELFGYGDLDGGLSPFLENGAMSEGIQTALTAINDLQYSAVPGAAPAQSSRGSAPPARETTSGWR